MRDRSQVSKGGGDHRTRGGRGGGFQRWEEEGDAPKLTHEHRLSVSVGLVDRSHHPQGFEEVSGTFLNPWSFSPRVKM